MKIAIDWRDPSYLRSGIPRQRAAYHVLKELEVFQVLAEYSPTMASTIPLGIDLPESDLEIIFPLNCVTTKKRKPTGALGINNQPALKPN